MKKMHSIGEIQYPIPPISILFDSTKSNRFLYNDILRYATDRGIEAFKFNEVAKWLIEHNAEFLEDYSDFKSRVPKSGRIANKRHRIQGCIENLVAWGFIQKIGRVKAEKNELETPIYQSMLEGDLLSYFLILDFKSPTTVDDTKTLEAILHVIESITKELDSSIMLFILDFFRRCHRKKTFASLISHFFNTVLPKYSITNGKELLVLFLGLKNCVNWILADSESFWNALNALDKVHRKIVLFQFKTEIESYYLHNYLTEGWKLTWLHLQVAADNNINVKDDFSKHVSSPGTFWLEARIQRANDYENVVIPSVCEKCNSSSAFAVGTTKYLESVVLSYGPHPSGLVSGNCLKCGAKFSVSANIMRFAWYNSPWT
jgi:hypothetical protein